MAGGSGCDSPVGGLFKTHQFSKVELFAVTAEREDGVGEEEGIESEKMQEERV